MSVYAGPEISQSGLIFSYDMGNTSKSWRGAPVTNEAKNVSNQIDWTIGNLTQSVSRTTVLTNEIYYISSSSGTGTSFRIGFPNATLVNGSTYTVSYKYKFISGGPVFRANDWCDTVITRVTTDLGGGVFYETATGTRATYDTTYRFLDFEISNNTVIQIWDLQLELGSFATPYSSTRIRTNTQAILDLTNNNTITAESLTYNSDGTFSFNGTGYINGGNLGTSLSNFTVELWFKSDSVSNYRNPIDCNFGTYGVNTGPRLEQNSSGNLIWVLGDDTTNYYSRTVVSSGLSSTPTHYTAITKNGANTASYYNGSLVQSGSQTYTHPGAMTSVNIGRGFTTSTERWFVGKIPNVKIYNRALSAAEIKQNFNALRSRFGV